MSRALIIGATGGIGAAVTARLLDTGWQVETITRADNGFDYSQPDSIGRALGAVEGPFDLILLATGILAPKGGQPEKTLDHIDPIAMAEVMNVNAIGTALVLQQIPRLLERNRRCVVAVLTARVGSIQDNRLGGWYAYRASKAAANQVLRCAAIEIGRKFKDTIVMALHPGTVATAFTQNYPAHKKVTPEQAAINLLNVIDTRTAAENGGFFDWRGDPIPW